MAFFVATSAMGNELRLFRQVLSNLCLRGRGGIAGGWGKFKQL
jgi:hypothetical protein